MEDKIDNLILIVDDNPHNIQVLAAVLNECNYQSGFAMSGKEAFAFLEENIPDLILLDIMMPDMNGYEVCKEIKKSPNLKDIPIIFLTAKAEKEDIIKGFEVGGADYVTKPFNNLELKMRIHNQIELTESKRELVELNKKLEKLNDDKDKFFSIIAHDLRGPIGNISQYIDFMMDDFENMDKDSLLEDFKILKHISKSSYQLLESLLIWASSQKGSISFNPELSNFHWLVQSNIELFQQSADKKNILLKNEVDTNLHFLFDHNMINTVIRNLLNNAIKYTSKDGEIIISAQEKAKVIEISIKDNGIGIPQQTIKNLFELNVKKFSTEGTDGEKGSGFGLVLSKEFIEKHNGKIWVESEVGKGSEFKFAIPI